MRSVPEREAGPRSRTGRLRQDWHHERFSDAWFLGGVPGLTAVVYAGNDDHKPLAKKGATGGVIAAPVWKAFVEEAVKGLELPLKFSIPKDADVESVKICRKSGFRAIKGCSAVTVYMKKNAAPSTTCPIHGGDMYASSQDPNAPRLILCITTARPMRLRVSTPTRGQRGLLPRRGL
jgi:membrane carboxypeptidase/penicillin-binding protein